MSTVTATHYTIGAFAKAVGLTAPTSITFRAMHILKMSENKQASNEESRAFHGLYLLPLKELHQHN